MYPHVDGAMKVAASKKAGRRGAVKNPVHETQGAKTLPLARQRSGFPAKVAKEGSLGVLEANPQLPIARLKTGTAKESQCDRLGCTFVVHQLYSDCFYIIFLRNEAMEFQQEVYSDQ